ncbi:MAG: hypothetical protein LBE36_10420 [Flavobacteriaceae bacterium]|nr:hypothetical protein [Flavobacteriaceae bacterium]
MQVIRKTVNTNLLKPIMDLPWVSGDLEVEVIVMAPPQAKETPQKQKNSIESLAGCLKEYANPALWEREQHAWANHIAEKYGNI